MAFLEDPDEGSEAGAEAEDVHDDGLDRDDDRAGHEEQQHEGGGDDEEGRVRESLAEPGLHVDELGGDPADLGVEGRPRVVAAGRRAAEASRPCDVPAGRDVDDGDAGGRVGTDRGADDAGHASATWSSQATNSALSASVSAMTVTGSVPRAGNRSARVRATSRTSDDRGRVRASPISKLAPRNGTPSSDEHDDRGGADGDGVALHPPGEPVEAALDVGDRSRRPDLAADRGEGGGQERDRGGHAQQDDAEAGDAERGEDGHAEHEQAAHGDGDGEGGEHHGGAGGGDGLDDGVVHLASEAAFLPEPVDHQQPVVDAEADAEHVDDVDREDRHVAEDGGGDEHGERGDDAGEGDEERHAGGAEPAEQEDHGDERDGQGDRLAAEEVVLRRGAELLADEHVPADEHLGGVEVPGDIGDLVRELDLGLLVETAGDGDDGERGATVAGAQGVGAGRPRVDDGDDAVDGGDPLRARRSRTAATAGSSTSMPSAMMAISPPVSARSSRRSVTRPDSVLGPAPKLGGEHREGGAADGAGGEQQHDPEGDDRAAAANDEGSE